MPPRQPPIARIRLARSLPRLAAWPALVIGTGGLSAATWALGSFGTGLGGIIFAALGGALVLVGLVVLIVLLSVRLEIHEAAVRLAWLGGERMYPLTRGPVTRVRLRGTDPSKLRPRFGMFGWALGAARLRDEEDIRVVRLARTPTAILVPTELGRLAIAADDEDELLDALSRAARARQRLDQLTDTAQPAVPAPEPPEAAEAEPIASAIDRPAEPSARLEVEPRVLTGIERALLEQRLAEERAVAGTVAAVGQQAVTDAKARPAIQPEGGETAPEAGPAPDAVAGRRLAVRRARPSVAFVFVPLLGAGAAWAVGLAGGTYPPPDSDAARLTALALVLAGPASSVGAIMALAWWPRLVGVIVSGGLAASVFIGRALLG